MASNLHYNSKKARAAARLFFVLLFLGTFLNLKAQNISNEYTSRMQKDGNLYFVLPRKGWKSQENHNHLEYDLTYKTVNDTVVLNFTYQADQAHQLDSLVIESPKKRIASDLVQFFVEPQKGTWHHRYSARFSFLDLTAFFNSKAPPGMILVTGEKNMRLEIQAHKWKKQSAIVSKIFDIIRLN